MRELSPDFEAARLETPASTRDLSCSELSFIELMQDLWFGRIESARIAEGEIVLDSTLRIVREIKFGSEDSRSVRTCHDQFELKRQIVDLFGYVRKISCGEIRCLIVKHGLPFVMEVEQGSCDRRGAE
jgi:hypothetical protein